MLARGSRTDLPASTAAAGQVAVAPASSVAASAIPVVAALDTVALIERVGRSREIRNRTALAIVTGLCLATAAATYAIRTHGWHAGQVDRAEPASATASSPQGPAAAGGAGARR
jgi:hypothetical protein